MPQMKPPQCISTHKNHQCWQGISTRIAYRSEDFFKLPKYISAGLSTNSGKASLYASTR